MAGSSWAIIIPASNDGDVPASKDESRQMDGQRQGERFIYNIVVYVLLYSSRREEGAHAPSSQLERGIECISTSYYLESRSRYPNGYSYN